jgi:UDP-N-acetylmuramate dehydrogenase
MITPLIQENVSLQRYNTLAVDVSTRWFVIIETIEQLQEALDFVKAKNCPLLVLGGGSNVVLAKDFSGLTLLIKTRGIHIEKETDSQVFLSVAAGKNWHDTVMYCVNQGWYGLENLALIPGSVGAAPIQNIGAYGVELTQCFSYLDAIDIATGERLSVDNQACQFAYRDSVFKQSLKDKVIITRVVLVLSKTPTWSLNYPALQNALKGYELPALTSQQIAQAVIAIRQSKLPDPRDIPNAGSFFKNPIVDPDCYERLREQYPQLVAYEQSDGCYKLAAGWLLDQAGWKGKWVNNIAMHDQQALVLTNPHRRSGSELLDFTDRVISDIEQKYGIYLEVEPRIYT